MDHEKERFEPAWERAYHIERGIRGLPGLKDASIGCVPPSGKGCTYHTLGLQINFRKSEEEVSNMVRSLREDDPEIWVRYWGQGTGFIINALNLLPGDDDTIVERFKKIFG